MVIIHANHSVTTKLKVSELITLLYPIHPNKGLREFFIEQCLHKLVLEFECGYWSHTAGRRTG